MLAEPLILETGDDLLDLSRRLDWRFVFADPTLMQVVVAGEPDNELINALEQFCDHVIIWQGQSDDLCDMLILHNPSLSLYRRTLKTFNPERFYIEFDAKNPGHLLQRLLCLAETVFLTRKGSQIRVRRFWLWPGVAKANRIIPLFQPEPISFVSAKGGQGLRAGLVSAGLDLLRRTGLLLMLVRGLSIAGERLS